MGNLFLRLSLLPESNYDRLKYGLLQNKSARFLSYDSHTPRTWEEKIVEMLNDAVGSSHHTDFF